MTVPKICFIAQFPPPIHGLSKAVDTLYRSPLNADLYRDGVYQFEKVNISDNKDFPANFLKIQRSHADLFYFTISQTAAGNLRDLMILRLLRMQHKKCLIHLHGGYYRHLVDQDLYPWQKNANYRAVRAAAGAIVLGNSLISNFSGMLPDDRIYVVPNCVDDQYLISAEEFQQKIELIHERPIKHVLYLSNFIRSKGYPQVLDMAVLEKNRVESGGCRKFHFDFAGKFFEESEKNLFFHFIEEHRLQDYVTYHGIVSGEEKRKLLRDSDVFVLLTRYPNEGQPISILEAMGNGMLVLTTDHAGIPDIVTNAVNGYCFQAGEDSAEPVYQCLLHTDLKPFEQNSRQTVLDHFTEKQYLSGMNRVFAFVLQSSSF